MAAFPNSITAPEILRPIIESEIERLIDILDTLDPDPDLEPSLGHNPFVSVPEFVDLEGDDADDEAELGWTVMESRFGRYAEGDICEPTLGSVESINQEKWSLGGVADLELDKADDEPSLGSTNAVCQINWGAGGNTDVEEQCDDEGALEHL